MNLSLNEDPESVQDYNHHTHISRTEFSNNLALDDNHISDSESSSIELQDFDGQLPSFRQRDYSFLAVQKRRSRFPYVIPALVLLLLFLCSALFFLSQNSENTDFKKLSPAEFVAEDSSYDPSDFPINNPSDAYQCSANKTYLNFADYHDRKYAAQTGDIEFVQHPTDSEIDGLYFSSDDDMVILSIDDQFNLTLATSQDVASAFKAAGIDDVPTFTSVTPSFDWKFLLIETNTEKVWRHSTISSFYVYDVDKKSIKPLSKANDNRVMIANWAPTGHRISYVIQNDLYYSDMNTEVRITNDGGENIFNGISDWVYEEEVFASPLSHWWSPDTESLIFVKYNDTSVAEIEYSLFVSSNSSYPQTEKVKYPKAGTANPTILLYAYKLNSTNSKPQLLDLIDKDWIITQVSWVTEGHSNAIIKVSNRIQNHYKIYLATATSESEYEWKMVRENNAALVDDAWIEVQYSLIYAPKNTVRNIDQEGYIDLVEYNGFVHLGYFSPLDSSKPVMLTSGNWSVLDQTITFDAKARLLYFSATKRASYSQETYAVDLTKDSTEPIYISTANNTPKQVDGFGSYTYKLSKFGKYMAVSYSGPNVPWMAIYAVNSEPKLGEIVKVVELNEGLRKSLASINLPAIKYYNISLPGISQPLDCSIIFPPCYDPTKVAHYSVLYHVYGGPNSKYVTEAYKYNAWNSMTLSASLNKTEYKNALPLVIVTVDPRGTAYKGRDFYGAVSRHLGVVEAKDIIASAEYLLKEHPSFDPSRVAIWGWSYGGYMTLKVLELSENTFKAGMSVAPVTDWKFYDSIYTERYMSTPQENPSGYNISAISDYTSISKKKLLLMHGTGDDNVHVQNSYVLLDGLQTAGDTNLTIMVYPDSDHSIVFHKARPYLDNKLATFLFDTLQK
ncbi:hypothetical protein BB560_002887 [Smittium megazygosporum]|uniref:Dipeptidyl-peptidase IV n=1 Tax=Smittium megazygosporum TaxID=133381 RepID=A0A2T9ZDJ5_9FUNG|nr:hypothetical protein BB560_002887 [Smittium megazygosporum]